MVNDHRFDRETHAYRVNTRPKDGLCDLLCMNTVYLRTTGSVSRRLEHGLWFPIRSQMLRPMISTRLQEILRQ